MSLNEDLYIIPKIQGDYLDNFSVLLQDFRENGSYIECRNFIKNYLKNTIIYETLKSFLEGREHDIDEIIDKCDKIYQALEKLDSVSSEKETENLRWQIQNYFTNIINYFLINEQNSNS